LGLLKQRYTATPMGIFAPKLRIFVHFNAPFYTVHNASNLSV